MNDKASAATQDLPVRVIPCGPAVNESERRAVERVKASLIGDRDDGRWLILTNLAFSASHRLQADEIDIVAIGPPGVRVIEVKHWTAAWVRGHDDVVAQEADRVTAKARKIGTTLRARLPNLPHVFGVFLVTEAAAKVERLPEEIRGVRFHTLKTCRQAVGAGAPAVLSLQEIRFAARRLEPRSEVSVTGELRRVAGYAHLQLQSPAAERFHRVYRAVHATRQDGVVLHFYDWSASEEPNAAAKAEREFQALHRLQRYAWAPRIIDSFQASPGYAGENAFFTIADPAAPSIAERAADESWDTGARLSFARSAVRAVRDLHGAGGDEPMVHRCLTARSILVRHDNSPILTDFQHARIPAEITVSSPAEGRTWDTATAPEVRAQGRGAADRRSDVYSLCASLQALFTEREDDASRAAAAVLARGRADEPNRRSNLDELEHSLSTQLGESPPATPPPPARFWTEDQVVPFDGHHYRIVGRLGSGGVGTAFKVVEIDRKTGEELGTYVGKVIHDRENGERVLYAHNLVRSHLRHAALSVVYQVASEWRDNAFAALMTWIEGEPLSEYAGLLRELAEDQGDQSEEALAIRWLRVACEALGELHRNGLVHGDVSPRNLILSGGDVVLTDFDCVGKVGEVATEPGTVMYSSPSRVDHHPATPSDDFFALAASMFHVLFARDPFSYEGARDKARGVNWNEIERADYPVLAPFIDLATAADRQRRLTDAAAAMRELQAAPASSNESSAKQSGAAVGDRPPPPPVARTERSENEVLWLRDLLQSYPGSRWGNRETRGLDSDFAERTYVETRLERALFDDLQEGTVSLVVLCGNAGDGKTALLQHLAARFGLGDHLSEQRIVEGQTAAGLTVRMNLDGSAAWDGRSSTVLLDHFLAPFQNGRPRTNLAHLLAINDGRLLEEAVANVRFVDFSDGLGFHALQVVDRSKRMGYLDVAAELRDIFAAIYPELGDLQGERLRSAVKDSFSEAGWGADGSQTSVAEPDFARFVEILRAEPRPDKGLRTLLARLAELEDYGFFNLGPAWHSLWEHEQPTVVRIHTTQNENLQRAFAALVFYGLYKDMFRRGTQERITHALIFDEAHRAARLKLIPTMAKECRKYGISLVLASQEARDFHSSVFSAIANYLVLRLTETDARFLIRNVASSQQERALVDRIKQMDRFKGLFFSEGNNRPYTVDLAP